MYIFEKRSLIEHNCDKSSSRTGDTAQKMPHVALRRCRRQAPTSFCTSLFPSTSHLAQLAWTLTSIICILYLSPSMAERAYPLGCSDKPSSFYDYENYRFPPENVEITSPDDYLILRRLGAGKFSDVFEAVDIKLYRQLHSPKTKDKKNEYSDPVTAPVDPRSLVVLKCLKPVSERKIKRELLVLEHASNKLPNLARLLGVVIPPDYFESRENKGDRLQPMPALALEHAGVESQWLCHPKTSLLPEEDIKYYLYHLLIALDSLHSRGIMHRDVKPRNVLINFRNDDATTKPLMLLDLGLADFFLPDTDYNVRVASRHYKSPELLLGFEQYDYAIDLWGVGCILAGLLLQREPFFRGKDNLDQLGQIVAVLGTADLHAYISKAKIEMTPEIRQVIAKYTLRGGKKQSWESLGSSEDVTPSPEGIDLISKLLVYDHNVRLTAKQAMQHPFFDSVRNRVERQVKAYPTMAGSTASSSVKNNSRIK
jgi:casein kinase II subunit alpha